ncbi:MAG: hypothetical protein AAGD00_02465 [Planctomycetota bacterium]
MSRNDRTSRTALTLVELLVVISIIVIAASAVLPAFTSVIRSVNFSDAVNKVSATLGSARALAIAESKSTGVAFLFDIETQQMTLVILEQESTGFLDEFASQPAARYVPARDVLPVELPPGIAVMGLPSDRARIAPCADCPGCEEDAYAVQSGPAQVAWYAGERINDCNDGGVNTVVPWLFPRSDPRIHLPRGGDPWREISGQSSGGISIAEAEIAVRHAQTFAVFFTADGSVTTSLEAGGQLVQDAYIEFFDRPVDPFDPISAPYDLIDVFDPDAENIVSSLSDNDPTPRNEEVVLRGVDQLAVFSLQALTRTAGITEPWFIASDDSVLVTEIASTRLVPDSELVIALSNAMDGAAIEPDGSITPNIDPTPDNVGNLPEPIAEIIGFNRFTGDVLRRSGL